MFIMTETGTAVKANHIYAITIYRNALIGDRAEEFKVSLKTYHSNFTYGSYDDRETATAIVNEIATKLVTL